MKAIVQDRYGAPADVLELREIEKPPVADDEVLVRVQAASVHADIWHAVTGRPYVMRLMGAGLQRPKNPVPGIDMAGTVEAVGGAVTEFEPGDEVFGETVRGHQWRNGGAFAEYVAVPEEVLAPKPGNLTFEQAAAAPTSALIALLSVREQGKVQPGQRVLVNGAAGGVGAFAVQLAKALGAEVTGVDGPDKLEMLRSIGADHVIDYTREDFTRGGEEYDVIVDIAAKHSFRDCRRALVRKGTYVLIGHSHYGKSGGRWIGGLGPVFKVLVASMFVSQGTGGFATVKKKAWLGDLTKLIEAEQVTPVIDRTYPLGEVVEAMRYLAEGAAQGKVVLTIGSGRADRIRR